MFSQNTTKKVPKPHMRLACVALTVVIATVFVGAEHAHAGFPYFTTSVTVSSPKPPAVRTYAPGQAMQFASQFSWQYCGNQGNFRVYGRTTRPVPVGQSDTAFSNWTEVTSGTGRKTFTTSFDAPMRPGVYRFRYQLEFGQPCLGIGRGTSCGGMTLISKLPRLATGVTRGSILRQSALPPTHTYIRSGVVTFEVRDTTPDRPACPANQIQVTRNGATVCVPQTLDLTCDVEPTRIMPGESATFTASTNQSATFTWYNGDTANGAVIGGPETGTESSLTRTFSAPGQYQVTAYAQNASGAGVCTQGVRVGDVEPEIEEVRDEFDNVVQEDGTRILPDGRVIRIDPTAGPATITFDINPTITNTTCGATWSAQNVAQCYMVGGGNRQNAPAIEPSGEGEVVPATYRVECITLRDGSIARSEERICRQNLDLRES